MAAPTRHREDAAGDSARADQATRIFGQAAGKTDPRIGVLGDIDELTSFAGLARARADDQEMIAALLRIGELLLAIGADVADPNRRGRVQILMPDCRELTRAVQEIEHRLPPLSRFVIPGGSSPAAELHYCRSLARRMERSLQLLSLVEPVSTEVLSVANELSDYFFALARQASHGTGAGDNEWHHRGPLQLGELTKGQSGGQSD